MNSLQADAFRGHGFSRFPRSLRSLRVSGHALIPAGSELGKSNLHNSFATKQRSDAGAVYLPSPSSALSFSKVLKDMEQNSEDAQGTKRSVEIHSGVKPELAQREPPGKRSCFAEYRLSKM